MPKIQSIKHLFDDQHEIMAWVTLLGAAVGVATNRLEDWPGVALAGFALITMLGAGYYKGVKIGPGGLDVE
jgi:hypothetical protein